MNKLTPFLLVAILSGCFGPATLDTTNKETVKNSVEKLKMELPEDKKEDLSKAIAYFTMGGESGIRSMMKSAFSNEDPQYDNEDIFITNIKILDGKTADEILSLHTQSQEKARADRKERLKVSKLKEEAEALLQSNKFQEALDKYNAMSLTKSGVDASEEGMAKTNIAIKEFAKKAEYIEQIEITEFTTTRIDTYTEKGVPAVRIGLKNKGDKSLDQIKVTVFFKDSDGNNIHEKDFSPILVSKYSNKKPLKPGYVHEMKKDNYLTVKSPLSDWEEGSAEIKIVDIKFTD